MAKQPSTNGDNGRDKQGRFKKGNPGGTGNPYAKKTAQLRSALIKSVTVKDIQAIAKSLVNEAKAGNLRAIDLLLNRVLGTPVPADVIEQMAELEQAIEQIKQDKKQDREQ